MISERRVMGLLLGGLLSILITALAAWFFTHFERRGERVPIGYSAEARRNELLAVERFLARLGIGVRSLAGRDLLWRLPPPTDTLVVRGLGPMSAEHRARLMGWLEAGGHLLVEAMDAASERPAPDDVLGALGIRLRLEDADRLDALGETQVLARVAAWDPAHPLGVAFQARYYLETEDGNGEQILAAGRPRLLRRAVGQGRLSVISDSGFMTNAHIGDFDHALFTAWLVKPRDGGKVWLLYDTAMPWLGVLLWSLAPQALISAGLLVLVWLWSLGGRLGPLTEVSDRRRRDLLEHLDASADFLWRHGRAARLVETSRRRVLEDWLRHRPEIARCAPHAQAERIAALMGRPVDAVARALFAQPQDARGLVEQGVLLRALWCSRMPGASPPGASEASGDLRPRSGRVRRLSGRWAR